MTDNFGRSRNVSGTDANAAKKYNKFKLSPEKKMLFKLFVSHAFPFSICRSSITGCFFFFFSIRVFRVLQSPPRDRVRRADQSSQFVAGRPLLCATGVANGEKLFANFRSGRLIATTDDTRIHAERTTIYRGRDDLCFVTTRYVMTNDTTKTRVNVSKKRRTIYL